MLFLVHATLKMAGLQKAGIVAVGVIATSMLRSQLGLIARRAVPIVLLPVLAQGVWTWVLLEWADTKARRAGICCANGDREVDMVGLFRWERAGCNFRPLATGGAAVVMAVLSVWVGGRIAAADVVQFAAELLQPGV
jgi:hypothetical protein